MFGAGGLFYESSAGLGAAQSAGTSMFSSVLGMAGLAMTAYNLISSGIAAAKQNREQVRLAKAQITQSNLLREKIQADNAGLYSAVQSSIAQTSGAMGAVY